MGQADLKKRLAGLDGLALDRINPRDHPRHRRGDFQHGPTWTLDDHAGHADRPLEGAQLDPRQRKPMFPWACLLNLIAAASSCLWS